MKTKTLMISVAVFLIGTVSGFAQMGGGMGGGHMGGGGMGSGQMAGGMGYGMGGAGDMLSGMMGNTISHGYLTVLNPINNANEARTAFEAFINSSNSNLQVSELWEYGTIFKAELSDTNGAKALDLIADKFTGAVMPEMGMSMMLNASYGKSLYKTSGFGKSLTVTPNQAKGYAQAFVDTNGLGYILGSPETYPGYYKFHTTHNGKFGMDIMVNGYDGGIWMNTLFGLPGAKY